MSETPDANGVAARLHWPTVLLGLIVAGIFLVAVFSYQVMQTEKAVVMTFGKISGVANPGLHFRWPLPIQSIVKYDVRLRCFEGNIGSLEQTMTNDQKPVTIGIYALYKIADLPKFHRSAGNIAFAEERLGSIMRSVKLSVIGKYKFDELVNTDPAKMKLGDVESEMLKGIAPQAISSYGLEVVSVGVKTIGVPATPSKEIAKRMISERNVAAVAYRRNGETVASEIKNKADKERSLMLADAEAKARRIKAEGDAEAADYYKAFDQNPELAAFLRKLESMKRILGPKTTLVLDTDSAPFDILKADPAGLGFKASAPAQRPVKKSDK